MTAYIPLGYADLALGALLILADAGLSVALQLRLERQILIAAARMVVQLGLMGMVLTTLFSVASPWWTLLAATVMIGFAGYEVAARQDRKLSEGWNWAIGIGSLSLSAIAVSLFGLLTALAPSPWYDPHYALPLLGMILGNAMTGIALGLNTLTSGISQRRAAVEAQLMLGATRTQALRPIVRHAIKTALMPIVNSMSATGIVAIPGMMTGQILGGVPPDQAVKYQILIIFLIAGAIGFGAIGAVLAGARRLTDSRHRLRLDRLG